MLGKREKIEAEEKGRKKGEGKKPSETSALEKRGEKPGRARRDSREQKLVNPTKRINNKAQSL